MPLRSFINSFRERVNLRLYGSKERNLRRLRYFIFSISLFLIGVLTYYYGFPHPQKRADLLLTIIKMCFIFYVGSYFIRFVYSFEPIKWLKNNWFEGLLMLLLCLDVISFYIFEVPLAQVLFSSLGIQNFGHLYTIFITIYLLIIAGVEISKNASDLIKIKLHPSYVFILSFLILIFGGSFLLMMPEMTTSGKSMNFIDALFTSTSATCVTGLMVEDTQAFFSFKGQVVILSLIKLGGLNIIAFGMLLGVLMRFGFGVRHHDVIEDFVNKESLLSSQGLLGKIVISSVLIELAGCLLLFFSWDPTIQFENLGDKVFHSVFHSISAFNNAGISLFTDGLYNVNVRGSYIIHLIVTALVFIGAMGFPALMDMFSFETLRKRLKHPWMRYKLSTEIALYTAIGVTIFGCITFYIFERNNTLEGLTFTEAAITSLFQSVTRTSGFNTVDIGALTVPMLLLMILMMFIGGGSGSTAGGIKTSTFALIINSSLATIQGKKNVEMHKRTIPSDLMEKAYSVFLFSLVGIFFGTVILTISDSRYSIMQLMFEQVSAFSTVGLSMGITPGLSTVGKTVIIVSMFVGRIGTLTVAFALSKRVLSTKYKYPETHFMVG